MKRTASTLAGLAVVAAILTGCTTTPEPTFTPGTPTPTPTETAPTTVEPPADEDEATAAGEQAITDWLRIRSEVNAAGGTDTAPLETIATGNALTLALDDAKRVAEGPIVNVDGESVAGAATAEGQITFELKTAYAQDRDGTPFGHVTIQACQDTSGYVVTTSDGKAAKRPDNLRVNVDYQAVYDPASQRWLAYDVIGTGGTC